MSRSFTFVLMTALLLHSRSFAAARWAIRRPFGPLCGSPRRDDARALPLPKRSRSWRATKRIESRCESFVSRWPSSRRNLSTEGGSRWGLPAAVAARRARRGAARRSPRQPPSAPDRQPSGPPSRSPVAKPAFWSSKSLSSTLSGWDDASARRCTRPGLGPL